VQFDPLIIGLAALVTLFAGFVKGAVGFGMPMIMISGLASFLAPEIALAALIIPTLVSNVWQALRGGALLAWKSVVTYRVFIGVLLVFIAISAQFVGKLSAASMFLIIGVPVSIFAATQLLGLRLRIQQRYRLWFEVLLGSIAGIIGGISGVWGPPTVAYLTATDTPKTEQIRVQGVVYGAGAIVLFAAHLKSGILNTATVSLSLALLVPAMVGMLLGFRLNKRLDQDKFRYVTLIVLVVAGLNLVRRGLTG